MKTEVRSQELEVGGQGTGVRGRKSEVAAWKSLPHMLILVLVLVLGAIWLACLKSPRAPSWDTEIDLPLSDNTCRLLDLLDHRYFSVGPDSVIQLQLALAHDTIDMGSRVVAIDQ